MLKTEDIFIHKCCSRIETTMGWGSSDGWTNHDFEILSEKIQSVTGIYLSVTTLKRIWGKVKYDSKPTVTTLDTLARFINFDNWRTFVNSESMLNGNGNGNATAIDHPNEFAKDESIDQEKPIRKRKWSAVFIGILIVVVAIGFFYFLSSSKYGTEKADPSRFQFSSKKVVSSGVPNSVIFDYDASAATVSDSVFIQQSWDQRLSQLVSPKEHQHTSIYYYPGFFQAKLVVNEDVVKEHNLLIQTEGWLPLVEQSPVPVYFSAADAQHEGLLGLSLEMLESKNIQLQPVTPWVAYYNVRNFGNLMADGFTFETALKSDYKEGAAACQHASIMILTEGSVISIPLSAKGCISDLNLFFIDQQVNGKKEDLSGFGCDFSDWIKVRCEVRLKKGKIFINDRLAYETMFDSAPTKITGIVYRFQGTGSVNSIRLSSADGDVVFEDSF